MHRFEHPRPGLSLIALAAVLGAASCGSAEQGSTLAEQDSLAVVEAIGAYVQGWRTDDTTGVLNTLDTEAVLVPAGILPITGREAIRNFWWPRDGSTTTILQYDDRIEEVTGTNAMAVVRSVGSLAFRWERGDQSIENTNHNRSFTILRKNADGRWLITHRMWASTAPPGR